MDNISLKTFLYLSAGMSCISVASASEDSRPNIILMIGDDCTYRDLGCYGSPNSITPNIDRLASEGMKFTNFFQAAPMSSPTRHCLMTGLYPVHSGAYPNHTFVPEGTLSVVQHMKSLGYKVALQGKKHISPKSVFDFEYLGGGQDFDVTKVAPYLEAAAKQDQPFCLFVCSNQPHTPWNKGDASLFDADSLVLPSYYVDTPETREDLTRYYAEVNYLDSQVGQMLDALDKAGLSDNTVFFFTSEQGNSMPYAKWTCYDMGLQTGMIVRWPGVIEPGSVSDAIAEYVDVTPTFVDIAGGDPESGFDGKSFLGVLKGETTEHKTEAYGLQTSRGIINGPEYFGIRSVRDRNYTYIRNLTPEAQFSCAMTRLKDPVWKSWVEEAETDEVARCLVDGYLFRPAEELYDRINDPEQRRNLADDPAYLEVKKALSAKLDAWMAAQGDMGQETELAAKSHQVNPEEDRDFDDPESVFLADPYIFMEDGTYYAYGTGHSSGIAVYVSKDLLNWTGPCGLSAENMALHKDDTWGEKMFWAPEVYKVDERYIMTYSVESRIAVAFSDSPLGPFRQEDEGVFTPDQNSIDSHIFIDDDGQAYMYWVRFGLGKGNEIRVSKLSDDLKRLEGEQIECLHATPGTWEVVNPKHRVAEGPFVLKHEGKYYLTYSCNHFRSQEYAVGYAVSDSPLGPWIRNPENPILRRHGNFIGTGHHSFITSDKGNRYIVFHAHRNSEKVSPRKMLISTYRFINNGDAPDRLVIEKPIIVPKVN